MTRTCTACHGSRVGDEFRGLNSGHAADVHYNRGMQCTDCHSGAEMHGTAGGDPPHRYAVPDAPRCVTCHPDDDDFRGETAHAMHRDGDGEPKLACQVCHSGAYKQCYGCHVSLEGGAAVYEVNAPTFESVMAFKIGLNPLQDDLHPEPYVVLRHAPIDPGNFAFYGADLLPAFDALPTWRMATPHAIQRATSQNESCGACHGVRELFLGPDDLAPYEIDANRSVLLEDAPGM